MCGRGREKVQKSEAESAFLFLSKMWTEQVGTLSIAGASIGSVVSPFGSASLFFQGVAARRTSLSLSFDSSFLCLIIACAHSPDIANLQGLFTTS